MVRDEFNIYIELFKRKEYKHIPLGVDSKGNYFYPNAKQIEAFTLINDDVTTFIGYGGTARTGKTIIEATQIIFDCMAYPDIAWGLGRKELTWLKKTALLTFFNQANFYGLKSETDFTYYEKANKVKFSNNSNLFLIDTMYKPSEPLNTRFGGFDLTRCAIDESNETEISVVNKLLERVGWKNNEKYKLNPKIFECFNSAKNHVRRRYWQPYKEKKETDYIRFIHAQPTDINTPAFRKWMENMLRSGDESAIQRQVYGNFDYEDDPSSLCRFDAIQDLFTNDHVKGGEKYISADLAMQGRDHFVVGYKDGGIITIEIDKSKSTGKEIEDDLKDIKIKYGVPNSHIVADSDGMGSYLSSYIKNIKTFNGGGKPTDPQYANIKTQCAYLLAEKINKRELKIICTTDQQERIVNELSQCLMRDNLYNDISKKKIISKDIVKVKLGRSPDMFDMLMMFSIFELKENVVLPFWE
jgi:hypothetical protein